jgi:DNA-binding transcriptional regulator YdaS (Cro superfamily)
MSLSAPERKELAAKLGVSEQYLYQCLTGRRDMDPVEAIRLERESQRKVTRFELCRRRGAAIWPELATHEGAANGYADMPREVRRAVAGEG